MSREGKCEAEGLAGRLLGAGCTDRSPWVPTQAVALLPCPDQHSPDWQLGPNRLGSWHSWQAEPPKFSWQRFTLSQCGPSPARPPTPYRALTWHTQVPFPSMPSRQVPWPLHGVSAPPGHSVDPPPRTQLCPEEFTLHPLTPAPLGNPAPPWGSQSQAAKRCCLSLSPGLEYEEQGWGPHPVP